MPATIPNWIQTSRKVLHFGLVSSNFGVKLSTNLETKNAKTKQMTPTHATPNVRMTSRDITSIKEKSPWKRGKRKLPQRSNNTIGQCIGLMKNSFFMRESRKSEFDPRLEQEFTPRRETVGFPWLCGEIGYRVGLLIPRLRVQTPPESAGNNVSVHQCPSWLRRQT